MYLVTKTRCKLNRQNGEILGAENSRKWQNIRCNHENPLKHISRNYKKYEKMHIRM